MTEAPKEIPTFKNIEEMMEFAKKKSAPKKAAAPRKRVDKRKGKSYTDPTKKENLPENIYRTTHYYLRPKDSLGQLLRDAKGELERCGPGSLVVVHNHPFDAECVEQCRSLK